MKWWWSWRCWWRHQSLAHLKYVKYVSPFRYIIITFKDKLSDSRGYFLWFKLIKCCIIKRKMKEIVRICIEIHYENAFEILRQSDVVTFLFVRGLDQLKMTSFSTNQMAVYIFQPIKWQFPSLNVFLYFRTLLKSLNLLAFLFISYRHNSNIFETNLF